MFTCKYCCICAYILETIALCGTRRIIFDIQVPSLTRVNSLCPQFQCLAIPAFCKALQKDKFYLSFWRPHSGLNMSILSACSPTYPNLRDKITHSPSFKNCSNSLIIVSLFTISTVEMRCGVRSYLASMLSFSASLSLCTTLSW